MIDQEPTELAVVNPIETPTYSIIEYKSSDLPPNQYRSMIFSKWLRSHRYGNPLFKKVSSNEYYANYHGYIERLLAKPGSLVRLAVLSDDHDIALGFSVSREDVLDYIHVHKDYRRIGIGNKLVPEGITTFTHITLSALDIWQPNPKYKHWKFNPFA